MVISGGKLALGYIGLLTGIIGIVLLIPLFVSISLPLERKYWWEFFCASNNNDNLWIFYFLGASL